MPTLPKRALRVSMPFNRKLLLGLASPAMERVMSLRPSNWWPARCRCLLERRRPRARLVG